MIYIISIAQNFKYNTVFHIQCWGNMDSSVIFVKRISSASLNHPARQSTNHNQRIYDGPTDQSAVTHVVALTDL